MDERRSRMGSEKMRHSRSASIKSTISSLLFKKEDISFSSNLSDYTIVSEISGCDDISYLYLARYIPTKELVGLKYTDLKLSSDPAFVQDLAYTVQSTMLLSHKNILKYHNAFLDEENLWVVTPPLHLGTCKQLMRIHHKNGFDESMVLVILKDTLRALEYLHLNNYIHNCDVRAENIIVTKKGRNMLTGMRRVQSKIEDGKRVRKVFQELGANLEWQAPEVIQQNSVYDERADIYSFGILVLELIFGKTPFDNFPPLKILLSKMNYACPNIRSDKRMSDGLSRIVGRCLDKDPKQRPSAGELLGEELFKSTKSRAYLKGHLTKFAKEDVTVEDDEIRGEASPNSVKAHHSFA